MYWWNVDALVQEFRANQVSEYEKYKYYLASTMLGLLMLLLTPRSPFTFISILIVFWGIRTCFLANQQGDGVQFIERMICLRFPLIIRFLVILTITVFPLSLALEIFKGTIQLENPDLHGTLSLIQTILGVAINTAADIIFYLVFRRKIRAVAQ